MTEVPFLCGCRGLGWNPPLSTAFCWSSLRHASYETGLPFDRTSHNSMEITFLFNSTINSINNNDNNNDIYKHFLDYNILACGYNHPYKWYSLKSTGKFYISLNEK